MADRLHNPDPQSRATALGIVACLALVIVVLAQWVMAWW
jgi:hypothetical protein